MDTENKYGTLEKQKKYLLFMDKIHKLCVKNNIEYSLCGGSLLGAIRHKGFIPWDDDMDISLTRENYEKFVEVIKGESEFEIVQDIWVPRVIEKGCAKSVCIDIFIFDNVPVNNLLSKIKVFLLKIIQGMMKNKLSLKKYSLKNKILVVGTFLLGRFFTLKCKQKLYSKISCIGNKKSTEFINTYNDLYKLLGLKYPKKVIRSYTESDFDGIRVMIMDGYDEYLKLQYGDYMTLPSEEERIPQHSDGDINA